MAKPGRFDWLFRPQLADEDRPLSAELRFAEALAELPAVERSALALSEIGGLDTDEIAERLGTDSATVCKLLARAREAVRTSLAARGGGLTALLPFQSLWQLGSSTPALRTAGAALAVTVLVGSSSPVGRTAAEAQPVLSASPDLLRVVVRERAHVDPIAPAPVRPRLAAPAAAAERRLVPPAAAPSPQPPPRVEPAGKQAAAAAPVPPPVTEPAEVAEAPVPEAPVPAVPPPPPVVLPVEPPVVLPVEPPVVLPVEPPVVLPPPVPLPPPLPLP